MDDPLQARAYAEADFSDANQRFLALFRQLHPEPFGGLALDVGCGPADIPLQFAAEHSKARIDALDGAPAMLALAQQRLRRVPQLAGRVRLFCSTLPTDELAAHGYHAVLSNSLLHHLADPLELWRTIRRCGRPDAAVLVMDLRRPESEQAVDDLVAQYAGDAPEVLRRDFRNSLFAAYTPEEIQSQLAEAGLHTLSVAIVSDRHLAVQGRLPAA
jgi:ubiquinone/menaquinone biosynthesis C-methylase UbiE